MAVDAYFDKASGKSIVQTRIVHEYFGAWYHVMKNMARSDRLSEIDLDCGPGLYGTGLQLTPLLVLGPAVTDGSMRNRLVARFPDDNPDHVRALESAIQKIPGIKRMRSQPGFSEQNSALRSPEGDRGKSTSQAATVDDEG
jgi:hypothetical protein